METKEINLFVFDEIENFNKSKSFLGSEGWNLKRIVCIPDTDTFQTEFNKLASNELVFMVVHAFYTLGAKGIRSFYATGLHKKYPKLGYMYISEGDQKTINKDLIDTELINETSPKRVDIYKYHEVISNLENGVFQVYTKSEITQQVVDEKQDTKMDNSNSKLFISHSSVDKETIKPLIDLLEDIGVPHNQIFFSSHPAYGVLQGEDIFLRLKKELQSNVFALFLLSENFYKSPVCLCEMGAVWIKSNKQIPILIPPFDFKDIKGVFPNSLGFKINDKDELNSFKGNIEEYFNLTPIHMSRWEEKRNEFLEKISELLKD